MSKLFKDYGIGVGLRAPHYHKFQGEKPNCIHWGEVISENFMNWKNGFEVSSLNRLLQFRKNMPIALHGVGMNLGSTDPLDMEYLRLLKELAHKIEPMWISDHICWTGVDGENLHDLNPLPYSQETINHLVEKIKRVQDYLGRRFVLENVSSYVEFKTSEMTEWQFINEILTKADCGVLLDVNNVYVSSVNHCFNPMEFIKAIPTHRIAQIHLAGHTVKDGYLIDTHDEPVCEDVWNLFDTTVKHHGGVSTMIERDDNIPGWQEIEKELLRANSIRNKYLFSQEVSNESQTNSARI